jgi:thiol:disulfide interchange protein
MRITVVPVLIGALLSSTVALAASRLVDTRWSSAAMTRFARASEARQQKKVLPEFRVYDRQDRLVYIATGMKPGTVAGVMDKAIHRNRAIDGPGFAATMDELETRDGKPALPQVRGHHAFTIVDYWAEWCVPCKIQGKELEDWAQRQPAGTVQIVRAETDPMAAARAIGEKSYKITRGPDGKMIKTEIK